MDATVTKRPLLPVRKTIDETYRFVWLNFGEFFRIAWCWLLLAVLALFLFYCCGHAFFPVPQFTPQQLSHAKTFAEVTQEMQSFYSQNKLFIILAALQALVPGFFGVSIAVAWHRLILRNEKVSETYYLRFDAVVWNYLWTSAVISLISFIPEAIKFLASLMSSSIFMLSITVSPVVGVIMVYYIVRLPVILPARALGIRRISFGDVLQRTRWNFWRLAWAGLLSVLPCFFILIPFSIGFSKIEAAVAAPMLHALLSVLLVVVGIAVFAPFYLTYLSLAFRHFFPEEAGART